MLEGEFEYRPEFEIRPPLISINSFSSDKHSILRRSTLKMGHTAKFQSWRTGQLKNRKVRDKYIIVRPTIHLSLIFRFCRCRSFSSALGLQLWNLAVLLIYWCRHTQFLAMVSIVCVGCISIAAQACDTIIILCMGPEFNLFSQNARKLSPDEND